ncbi:uncharacterized protein LOC124272778 [Haliotis rubra]|uniref:uncharacterized protein LOC124272778 n=1 Tax=Haliotis rubra TaxID=36100 RepID=UPI001EE635A1|nr:uncharacterized protein LOC124272778 [Haliotis rubra]
MDGGRDTRKGRRLEDERQQAGVSDIRPVKVLYSKEDVRGTTEISPRQPPSTSMGPRPAMMQQEPSMPYSRSLPRHDPQSDFWTQNLKPAPDIRAEQLQAEFLSPSRSDLLQGQTVTPYQRRGYPIDVAASQPGYEYQDYNRQAPQIYGQMRQPVRSNYQTYQGPNLQFAPAYQQYDHPYYAVHRYENEFMNPPLWNGPPAANPPVFPRDTPPPLYNTSHDYFHSGRSTLPRRMQQSGAFAGYTTPPTYNMHTAQSNMPLYQDQGYSPQNYMVNQSGRTSQESLSGPTTKSTDSSSGSANTLHLYDISELPPKMRGEAGNVSSVFPKTASGQVASGADNGHHQPVVVASTRKDLSKALDEFRQQSVQNQDLHGPEKQHQSVEAVVKTGQEVPSEGSDDLDRAALLLQEAIMDAGIDEIDGVFIKRNSHLVPQDNDQDGEATQAMDNHVSEEDVRVDKGDAIQLEAHEVNLSTRGSVDPLSNCYQHESNDGIGSGANGTDVKSISVSAVLTKNTLSEPSESSCDGAQSFMSCTEQDNIIKSLIHCCTDFDQSTETKQSDADNVCRQPPSVEHTLDQEIAEFMGNSTCQMYTEGQAGTSAGGTVVVTGWSEGKTTRLTTFIDGESQDPRQTFGSMGSEVLHPSSTFEDGGGALWYPYCETDAGCLDYLNNNMLPFGPHTAQFVPGPDATFSAMDWRRSFCGRNPTQGIAPSVRPGVNDYSVYSMSQSRQAVDMPFFENWDLWSPDARTVGRQVGGSGHVTVTQAANQYTNMADIMPCPTTEVRQAQGFPGISFADFMSESTQDVTATVISSDPTQSETNLAYMWQLAAEGFETPSNSCKEVKGETIHDSSDCGGSEALVNGDAFSGQTVSTGRDSHETRDELTTDQSGPSSGTPSEDVSVRVDDSSTPSSNLNCEASSTCSPDEAGRCVESNVSRVPLCPDSKPVPGSMSPPVYTRQTEGGSSGPTEHLPGVSLGGRRFQD